MRGIGRQTITFFLPNDIEAFTSDQSPSTLSDEGVGWYKMQLYINPSSITFADKKIIKEDLTKGGYVMQYWGEELTSLTIRGTTGSSGIEGINVIRSIYRHEQGQYRKLLRDRRNALSSEVEDVVSEAIAQADSRGVVTNALDLLTAGAYSQTIDGLKNTVELINNAITGQTEIDRGSVRSMPTLAALASNVDMYYQGEFFRGYFKNMTVTESVPEVGLFNYDLTFTVTRRTGARKNFMPWHRNPLDSSGVTQMSKSVTDSKGDPLTGGDNLTFPITGYEESNIEPEVIREQDFTAELDNEISFLQNRPGQG